jgi:hypothetical protein
MKLYDFSSAAAKAHVAAVVALLSTLLTYVSAENWNWDPKSLIPAVLAALVAALGVYHTSNARSVPDSNLRA